MQFNNIHRIQRGFLKSVSVPFNLVRILETSTYSELDLFNFVYRILKTVSFTKLRKIGELWKKFLVF